MGGKTPWLLLVLALAAIAVPLAQGTSGATDPRVAGLIRKVNTLQRQVNTLNARLGCMNNIAPVSRYGGLPAEGYLYQRTGETTTRIEAALDITEEGAAPNMLIPTVNPQCVGSARVAAGRSPNARNGAGVRLMSFKRSIR
jgi:hypothetical protein